MSDYDILAEIDEVDQDELDWAPADEDELVALILDEELPTVEELIVLMEKTS